MKLKYGVLALGIISCVSHAEVSPQSTYYDSRVQTILYNPDDVTRVKVGIGVSTLIQLEKNETLLNSDSGFGLGDPLAWEVAVRGNNIWLRPKQPQPNTNVTMVTNKRTYIFSLEEAKGRQQPSWLIRFRYPAEPKPMVHAPVKPATPCSNGLVNRNYEWKGDKDKDLAPVQAWDDGRFTCLKFSRAVDLPVVYWKWKDGKEGLVNSHMEDDVMVIHQVSPEYRIRLGDRVVGLRSNSNYHAAYSTNGTTTGQIRETITNGNE